jgi:hypothetical protein
MKVLAIGDLHGKDCWKEINLTHYDRVIFIGDYVDSPTIEDKTIVANLKEIIELKVKLSEKVVLLLGNHDIQYMDYPNYQCSGFNWRIKDELATVFQSNRHLFQVAYQSSNWLFTHAGVTNTFFHATFKKLPNDLGEHTVASVLNDLQASPNQSKLHIAGQGRGGFFPYSGVTWADMKESAIDYLPGLHQVVGHTRVMDIISFSKANSRGIESSITYIDVLDSLTKFFEVEIHSD